MTHVWRILTRGRINISMDVGVVPNNVYRIDSDARKLDS